MKKILILGAGRSAPYLIDRMIGLAPERDWHVTVADADLEVAQQRVDGRPNAAAVVVDARDEQDLARVIKGCDIVANVLAPRFQPEISRLCIDAGAHMVSVSYLASKTESYDSYARERGVLLLGEMGLDPGIDHMMAADAIRRVKSKGGKVRSFKSWGSGVPAMDSTCNPLRYLVTWNPWNVATSGSAGAQYLLEGFIRIVPHSRLFLHTWPVDVEGVGRLEGYPNRDSLTYVDDFDVPEVKTMIRGTLRHSGYCETWAKVVRLGLANHTVKIPRLGQRSPREVLRMFMPIPVPLERVEAAATLFLELNPTGKTIEDLRFLGLFDSEPTGCQGDTAADMLAHLLERRLAPQEGCRDMVILVHEMEVEYPGKNLPAEKLVDTMVEYGEPLKMSAMAKTVGLPAALSMEMILAGELDLVGCQIPTHPEICDPILKRLTEEGLQFHESVTEI